MVKPSESFRWTDCDDWNDLDQFFLLPACQLLERNPGEREEVLL